MLVWEGVFNVIQEHLAFTTPCSAAIILVNGVNASKPVTRHFNLPNMVVCGLSLHQGSSKSRKTLEQKLFFKSALLILTVSMNAFLSTNLFCCFSRYQAPANSVAPSFCI